jgi:metal-sulfur cluster biosynthetic enzyme
MSDSETTTAENETKQPLCEDKVREALKQVIDPELYVNIVDLGLVYTISIGEAKEDGRHDVAIEMTLTSPMCPAGPQLVAGTKGAAEGLDQVDTAEVKVVMDPPWSPDKMTDDARDHLGIF